LKGGSGSGPFRWSGSKCRYEGGEGKKRRGKTRSGVTSSEMYGDMVIGYWRASVTAGSLCQSDALKGGNLRSFGGGKASWLTCLIWGRGETGGWLVSEKCTRVRSVVCTIRVTRHGGRLFRCGYCVSSGKKKKTGGDSGAESKKRFSLTRSGKFKGSVEGTLVMRFAGG